MFQRFFLGLFSIFLCVVCLHASEVAKLRLLSGAELVGPLLKESSELLVVDLGYTALNVPRSSIVSIERRGEKASVKPVGTFGSSLYREQIGSAEKSLRKLVAELGEAVVMVRTPIGLGSGFMIHPDGYLVTNDHVIAGERRLSVTMFRRTREELIKDTFDNVRIVASGGNVDLALLKIEGVKEKKFPTVPLGRSEDLRQGDRVFAIGNPLGLERSVSEGIVSLRNRIIQSRLHVQTTAEINPGNSGGPLFNYRGEVVGVNNLKIVSTGAEGLGFAIPVRDLKTFLMNRDAYAFDPRNPNAGFRYNSPPR